jgi:polysaccharide lyase-like protein
VTGGTAGAAGTGPVAGAAGSAGNSAGSSAGGAGAGSGGSAGGATGPCGHPGEVFCEDFESVTTLDPARWVVERIGEGTAVIDTAIAHSGTRSVHVTQIGYNAFATLKGASLFPSGSRFYVRVFMRLAAPMTGGHNTYFIAGLAATPGAPYETRIGVQNEMLVINQPQGDRGFLSNQNFYNDHLPGAVLGVNAWSCVEVFFDPPATTINVWLDDAPIPDLNRTDWQQATFDVVRFGFERYAGPDAEIWYDDIAVGTQKIGCR